LRTIVAWALSVLFTGYPTKELIMRKTLAIGVLLAGLVSGAAHAQYGGVSPSSARGPGKSQASCESTAVSKDGKPLSGTAKADFVKKCKKEIAAGRR
jgi:hypothetical protein